MPPIWVQMMETTQIDPTAKGKGAIPVTACTCASSACKTTSTTTAVR